MQTRQLENPFLEKLGAILHAWREGEVEIQLPIDPSLLNRTGKVHGGVICTLLDAACGYAGLYTPAGADPLQGVTLSLTTNFLDSGGGAMLTAKGFLERRGRKVYFARAEVWLDDVLLAATAIGTFRYIRPGAGAT
ncbi:PaaI family thioesterase [Noviherbaspirillum sedimenti]|uniref:PaaI family thioesterase n=1 Tax=Noviherbaspirillum sedimenti TaxID=2320865 RepID=A0A3A3G506_9BURK|nr:PaaI family thioesterase [Noviherbaspirillum sedimenti]RJG02904.1 PaaI family thioesterase [Noviherbaspirillum sedimenti]